MTFRGLLTLLLAVSLTMGTIGCGKPSGKRRGSGSTTGAGTDPPKKSPTKKKTGDPEKPENEADTTPLPSEDDTTPLPPEGDTPPETPEGDTPETPEGD